MVNDGCDSVGMRAPAPTMPCNAYIATVEDNIAGVDAWGAMRQPL